LSIFREIYLFLLFTLILIFISSLLTTYRTKDQIYQYADVSLKNSIQQENFFSRFQTSFFQTLSGNFGETLTGEKVSSHIKNKFIPTLQLAIFSILLGGISSVFLSLFFIYKEFYILEKIFLYLSIGILSTPIFIVAVLLFLIFFLYIPILPPGGYEWQNPTYLVLPGLTLGSRIFARLYIFSIYEIKKEQEIGLIRFLYARGLPKKIVFFKYIFFKILPILSILILLDLSSLLSGAMIVEEIFFFPGIGKSMYLGIKSMDTNLLRGLLIYTGIIFYILSRVSKWLQVKLVQVEI